MQAFAARSGFSLAYPPHLLPGATRAAACGLRGHQRNASRPRCTASDSTPSPQQTQVLLMGITGVTGRSAVEGLIHAPGVVGERPIFRAATRSPEGSTAEALLAAGVDECVACDLDDPDSIAFALRGHHVVYCHGLSKDGVQAGPKQLQRARHLVRACQREGIRHLVYHSAGGKGCGYGITEMDRCHEVEAVFKSSGVPFTALEATLWMEELCSEYLRTSVMEGHEFPFSVPSDKPIQLLAARDLGLVVRYVINDPARWAGATIELAGDSLTPVQICEAFSQALGAPVMHSQPATWPFWFLNRDIYRTSCFLSEHGYSADVEAVRQAFPGMLTFAEFLQVTNWARHSLSDHQHMHLSNNGTTNHSTASQSKAVSYSDGSQEDHTREDSYTGGAYEISSFDGYSVITEEPSSDTDDEVDEPSPPVRLPVHVI